MGVFTLSSKAPQPIPAGEKPTPPPPPPPKKPIEPGRPVPPHLGRVILGMAQSLRRAAVALEQAGTALASLLEGQRPSANPMPKEAEAADAAGGEE